jgi:hypothetical protein
MFDCCLDSLEEEHWISISLSSACSASGSLITGGGLSISVVLSFQGAFIHDVEGLLALIGRS